MTNRKTTKRAFLASVMAIIICFSMLLGTTYAWFTDTVVAGRNRIVSGNLDVELDYEVVDENGNATWLPVEEDTNLFNENALYEPGYTEVVKFRVRNVGTLAVKCNLGINIINETAGINVYGDEFMLSKYLQTGVVDTAAVAGATREDYAHWATETFADATNAIYASDLKLVPNDYVVGKGEDEAVFEIVVTMPEEVGNEANFLTDLKGNISTEGEEGFTNQPEIIFGIKLAATQWDYEADDFGTDYDKDAEYPVYDEEDLAEDLSVPNSTTILTENVWVTKPITLAPGATLDGNGHVIYSSVPNANIGTKSEKSQFAIVATEGTIKNLSIVGTGRGVGTYDGLTGDLTLDNYYAAGGSYYFNIGNGNGHKFTVKNSTLSGWGSFGGEYDSVLFQNCKFERGVASATIRAYDNATFRACDFEAGFNIDVMDGLGYTQLKVRGCTYNGNNANAAELISSNTEALALGLIDQADFDAYNWLVSEDPNK